MSDLIWTDPPQPTRRGVHSIVETDVVTRPNTWAKVATMPNPNSARNAKRRLLAKLDANGRRGDFEARVCGAELYVRYIGG